MKLRKSNPYNIVMICLFIAIFMLSFTSMPADLDKRSEVVSLPTAVESCAYTETPSTDYAEDIVITEAKAIEPETGTVTTVVYKLTAYCPCTECSDDWGRATATGAVATAGRTVAVDPTVIPYGTEVIIDGHTYVAEDCGGAVKGNVIDIFFDTHEEVDAFGMKYAEVIIGGRR